MGIREGIAREATRPSLHTLVIKCKSRLQSFSSPWPLALHPAQICMACCCESGLRGMRQGLTSTVFYCTLETRRKARRLQGLGSFLEAPISTGVCDRCVIAYAQRMRPHLYINNDIRIKECTAGSGRETCQSVSGRQPSFVTLPHCEAHDTQFLLFKICNS